MSRVAHFVCVCLFLLGPFGSRGVDRPPRARELQVKLTLKSFEKARVGYDMKDDDEKRAHMLQLKQNGNAWFSKKDYARAKKRYEAVRDRCARVTFFENAKRLVSGALDDDRPRVCWKATGHVLECVSTIVIFPNRV